MPRIAIFCEDSGHEKVVSGLLVKLLRGSGYKIDVLSARHGEARALSELKAYLNQVRKGTVPAPDAIVAAIDANCKGIAGKKKEIDERVPVDFSSVIPIIHAIPDPHVERWLLVDSAAFKAVFGKGCNAPDQKCEKDRYKSLLNNAIIEAGGEITIGWIEHADAIIEHIDVDTLCRLDESVKKFADEVNDAMKIMDKNDL